MPDSIQLPLKGYKTYIAAGLAFMGCLYYIAVEGDMEKGFELFVIALGLAGLRNAIGRTTSVQ